MMFSQLFFILSIAFNQAEDFHPRQRRQGQATLADKENIQYWMDRGSQELKTALEKEVNKNLAKNVIVFIGDGMSLATVTAARVFKGQHFPETKENRELGKTEGNSGYISWDRFPNVGLSKTYSVNGMTPDSASTATAMFSGVKTISGTMGFDSHIVENDASSEEAANKVETILDWAQKKGMKTGFITNTRVTHATPAALYAKTANRDWECDSKTPKGVKDIAKQMIEDEPAKSTDIIFGGGLAPFVPYDLVKPGPPNLMTKDFDYATEYWNCHRDDQRDLVKEWQGNNTNGAFIKDKNQLKDPKLMEADKVLGLFSWSYMPYEDQYGAESTIPTLTEMTTTAIEYLKQKSGDMGFFLMVEGGKIDHAHHSSQGTRALHETVGLDNAVKATLDLVDTKDTMIIVTADHSHTFTLGGYADRFADITQVVEDESGIQNAKDSQPYTILSYANGPGFSNIEVVENKLVRPAVPIKSMDFDYVNPSGVPMSSETHGGDDVGIWAIGPMSHLFHGVHEQSYIAHVVSYAACIGPQVDEDRCPEARGSGTRESFNITLLLLSCLTAYIHI